MRLPNNLEESIFVTRPNRFAAVLDVNGERVTAHVANSGRMHELMIPGTCMYLTPVSHATRKTAYDLTLVEIDGVIVSADARLPLPLVDEAIAGVRLPQSVVGSTWNACRRLSVRDIEALSCSLCSETTPPISLLTTRPIPSSERHLDRLWQTG